MNKYRVHLKSGNVIEIEHEDLQSYFAVRLEVMAKTDKGLSGYYITFDGSIFTLDQIAAIESVKG